MNDIIKLLPDHVANQIAAGEVIQRPASVVKELLDNAIDAGSTEITLIIRDGGRTLIQLIDNGKGMSPTDARLCWERHATSKIKSTEDIYSVRTMGFRGEALASIASVAQVELKTKRIEDTLGTYILIEATEVKKQELISFQKGTSITVKNLFFNIPARRNFLKSNAVETRHIIEEFIRASLANHTVSMRMYNNDEEVYYLKASELNIRISEIFGDKTKDNVLHLDEHTTIANISAYIGKPEFSKKSRGEQYLFVNNRFIRDAYLNHAVSGAYDNLITREQFPFYIIFIDIEPSHIDVNVHPTKTEIKFEDEKSIYHLVRAVIRRILGHQYHVPVFEPSSDDSFLNLSQKQGPFNLSTSSDHLTVKTYSTSGNNFPSTKTSGDSDWRELYSVLNTKTSGASNINSPIESSDSLISDGEKTRNIMQVHASFIFSQIKSGVLIINQQSAHERVLFEKFTSALQFDPISCQQKLFPKTVTLHSADEIILKEILPEIRLLGYDINELGKNMFVVNGVPFEVNNLDEQGLIEEIIENYKQQTQIPSRKERIALVLAKRSCIKNGTLLSQEEMINLIDELFACSEPYISPDGKKCMMKISLEEIMGMFIH